ncbi:hypothetical protein [Bradyrhizobium sp.]|uniref:hypothetical protein n=1 Tax=Bradyrhizobium sp. TaxID=376 RepID=UPI0023913F0B|nr:hypothetical protein [Bradyrhizobium sp.]MDE2377040.1 hypothetical protein [Bradyrhizobium sp.]
MKRRPIPGGVFAFVLNLSNDFRSSCAGLPSSLKLRRPETESPAKLCAHPSQIDLA